MINYQKSNKKALLAEAKRIRLNKSQVLKKSEPKNVQKRFLSYKEEENTENYTDTNGQLSDIGEQGNLNLSSSEDNDNSDNEQTLKPQNKAQRSNFILLGFYLRKN